MRHSGRERRTAYWSFPLWKFELSHGVIRLTPPGTDWAALTSDPLAVSSPLPPVGATPVKLEIAYRQPFYQYVRLVAGRFPAAAGPRLFQVAVTALDTFTSYRQLVWGWGSVADLLSNGDIPGSVSTSIQPLNDSVGECRS